MTHGKPALARRPRKLAAAAALIAACSVLLLAVQASGGSRATALADEGVGTYTDPSVANQVSTFTVNPRMVSCGVGTVAAGRWSGPFAMLMYSTAIESYAVERGAGRIRASGRMRSITQAGGHTLEDVDHHFRAVAEDGRDARVDRFDVHLRTAFWNTGNLMCTPSSVIPGGCRFGGDLLMGEVVVGP